MMSFTKDQAKEEVRKLVENYKELVETGDSEKLTEEETKKGFIEPLFRALNWDIENYREVSAEETISKKRVDYGFRIDGIPKFFLEAKPLKEKLEAKEAEQAINYSWLKSTTWAVLTNFIELKIYNAEWKSKSVIDKRFIEIEWTEYIEKFDKLWLLSKDSFLQNELDKVAEEWGKKQKKTPLTPVIRQLFSDLMIWRQRLTRNISGNKTNMKILETEDVLDESVQRILDRLIFIRVCEDRELEPRTLLAKFREWKINRRGKSFSQLLNEVFREFDQHYNSKLFSRHISEDIVIDDLILNDVIHGLYESPDRTFKYDFAAIDADVLGNIYEEYLGYVLKKGKMKIAENHLHRKEMGIYYTPTFVVDYIVKNTLGELLKQKGDGELKVLDPACGSGSFLIKAFGIFLDYYKDSKQLTFDDKRSILENNIFGVDLDPKATEITQLNLLLRAVEKRKNLPMLQNNVKFGNSLIDDPVVAGDKAFKWEEEFKEVMKEGGFDVVIGNPPYVRQEELGEFKPYFEANYESYRGTADLLVYFFERGISLLRTGGYFGFIASNKFMRSDYGVNLRKYIVTHCSIEKIIDFGELPVFKDASTFPCIFIFKKDKPQKNHKLWFCAVQTLSFGNLADYVIKHGFEVVQSDLSEEAWQLISDKAGGIIEKMNKQGVLLKKYLDCNYYRGILTGFNEAFIINKDKRNQLVQQDPKSTEIIKPLLRGKDILRYGTAQTELFLIFARRGINITSYPAILKHLEKFKEDLRVKKPGEKGRGRKPGNYLWYEIQDTIAYFIEFDKPKIIYGDISLQNRFTIDMEGYYPLKTCFIIPKADKYLLALLNSKLFEFYMRQKFPILGDPKKGGRILHGATYMNRLPIKVVDISEQQPIIKLVDKMLSLKKRLNEIGDKRTDERVRIEQEINKTDSEIDALVYRLYGISEEEKKIVEEILK